MIDLLERYPRANRLLAKTGKEKERNLRLDTAKLRSDLRRFDLCVRTALYNMLSIAAKTDNSIDLGKNPLTFSLKLTELTRIADYGINVSSATKEFEDPTKWDTRCKNLLS